MRKLMEDLIQLDRHNRTRNNKNKTIERVDNENYFVLSNLDSSSEQLLHYPRGMPRILIDSRDVFFFEILY